MSIWIISDLCLMDKKTAKLHRMGLRQQGQRQQGRRSNRLFPQVCDRLVTQCLAGCVVTPEACRLKVSSVVNV